MSEGVAVAIIAAVSSLVLALINVVRDVMRERKRKKSGAERQLGEIAEKLDKLSDHNDLQYLSLLRLTVMAPYMPMSERLIAGRDYLTRGGNGDVKKFYEELERGVNG